MRVKQSVTLIISVTLALGAFHNLNGASFKNRIKIQKSSQLLMNSPDSSEEFNFEKMEILSKKRRSLIQDIKKFIREARSMDQKTELNLRLGGLYMEDYHSSLARAQMSFERETINSQKNKNAKQVPKLDTSEAIASLDKARIIYKDLASRFPNHPRRDEMIYFIALSALDKGMNQEGMNYFKQLSEQTPKSKFVTESLLQLGDHYFDNNKYPEAEAYYDKIIHRRDKRLIPYALYKKGWCAYNTQRPAIALQNFKAVINREDTEVSGADMRLKSEALRDIALPFAELKLVEEAIEFYRSHGDPHHRRGVETIAGFYLEKGDYQAAVFMYDSLLLMDANHPKNPNYDLNIVDSLKMSGQAQKAINKLFAQFPNYMENSSWYEINSGKPEVVKEASNRFEETARKYALEAHAEGQKTKNDQLYKVAKSLYEKYLEYFPRTPHSPQVRFYLAEILYKQNQFLNAADHYYAVYKDPSSGNMRLDAIRYALNSLDKQMNAERKQAGLSEISTKSTAKLKDSDETELTEEPYSPIEVKFMNVSNDYLASFPKAKDAGDVLYAQSYLQYVHHDFERAYKHFWQLVQTFPGQPTSFASAYLVMDILNRRKEYAKLVIACDKFLSNRAFAKADFRNDVANVLRLSELKRISLIEDKREYKTAALAYVEYTKTHGVKDENLFEKALYNASVNYFKAGLLTESLETQEKFLRRFTKSGLRENMLLQVAKTYETLANFEKAANYFEQFASHYPQNTQAKTALRLSGIYYWGSNNTAKAESVMRSFITTNPREMKLVERDLLSLYESQSNTDKQIRHFLSARSERGVSYADYLNYTLKIADLQSQKLGRWPNSTMEEALKVAQKYSKDIRQTKAGIEATAKTLFWYTNQKEALLYRIRLSLPQKQLEINLQRKLALLKELEKDYATVAKLGGGESGLGAIYKTASAFRHMANEVQQAPVPAELSGEQLEQYRTEIQKQMIKPFNEKALSLVGQCLDKAQEFNLLSKWTPKCYSLGGEVEPSRYPPVKTFYLPSVRVAIMKNQTEAKTPSGSLKNYAYPFDSSFLFNSSGREERSLASMGLVGLPTIFDGNSLPNQDRAIPLAFNYKTLGEERKELLNRSYEAARSDRHVSFAALHLLRLTNPQKATASILEAIQRDPNNSSLHNLLGLSYLDNGNISAARVTWLSLLARGISTAEVLNNLGVLNIMEGREQSAIEYFKEATEKESSTTANLNLGFLSLKYRNGFQAKQYFEKAAQDESNDVTLSVGLAVAKIQNREFDAAKESLAIASKRYSSDPYGKLSLVYLMLDVEKEPNVARELLGEYTNSQSGVDSDIHFREAIQQAKSTSPTGNPNSGESLPGLGN